jgi:hypothetical protein
LDATTLENYITRYGWVYSRYDDVVAAGVQSAAGDFLVTFQLALPWLRLSAPALAPGKDRPTEYYAKLLELNDRSRLARFALGESGDVMLCVDLYTDPPPTFEQFSLALDVLVYYAETALPHLQAGSGDEEEDEA